MHLRPAGGPLYTLLLLLASPRAPAAENSSELLASEGESVPHPQCHDCSPGRWENRAEGTCEACSRGRYQNSSSQESCIDCPPGRFQHQGGSSACEECPVGSFFSQDGGATACGRCPEHAVCTAEFPVPQSLPTYHLLLNEAGEYEGYRCRHGRGTACAGGNRCIADPETGEEAMEGPFCGKCKQGFGRLVASPSSVCVKCASAGHAALGAFMVLLLVAVVTFAVVLVIFATDFSEPCQLKSIILKQTFNYMQMATIVLHNLDLDHLQPYLDTPVLITKISEFTGLTALQTTMHQFSAVCFYGVILPDVDHYKIVQVIGLLWVPFVLVSVCCCFGLCCLCVHCIGYKPPTWRRLCTAMVVALFLVVQQVTEMNLLSWLCYHYDVPRLVADPSVECLSSKHRGWQIVGGFGCIVYSLGIPLCCYFVLFYFGRQGRLYNRDVLEMFGFLYTGFEPQFWYFECLFMLRKVAFTIVLRLPGVSSNNPDQNANMQNVMLGLTAVVFLTTQVYFSPYDDRGYFILDRIETASMVAIASTPLLGLWASELQASYIMVRVAPALQELIIVIMAILLHTRVLVLVFWGLVKCHVEAYLTRQRKAPPPPRRGKTKHLVSAANSMLHVLASLLAWGEHGEVQPFEGGLKLQGVRGYSRDLLSVLLQDIVALHISRRGAITYEGLVATLQCVTVEALRARDERNAAMENPLRFWLRRVKKRARRIPLPVLRNVVIALLDRLQTFLHNKGFRVSRKRNFASSEVVVARTRRSFATSSVTSEACFDESGVRRTFAESFTIDELYSAFIQLGSRAFQETSPLLMEEDWETISQLSTSGFRTSQVLLSEDQVVDSRVRAAHMEVKAAQEEKMAVAAELLHLRQQRMKENEEQGQCSDRDEDTDVDTDVDADADGDIDADVNAGRRDVRDASDLESGDTEGGGRGDSGDAGDGSDGGNSRSAHPDDTGGGGCASHARSGHSVRSAGGGNARSGQPVNTGGGGPAGHAHRGHSVHSVGGGNARSGQPVNTGGGGPSGHARRGHSVHSAGEGNARSGQPESTGGGGCAGRDRSGHSVHSAGGGNSRSPHSDLPDPLRRESGREADTRWPRQDGTPTTPRDADSRALALTLDPEVASETTAPAPRASRPMRLTSKGTRPSGWRGTQHLHLRTSLRAGEPSITQNPLGTRRVTLTGADLPGETVSLQQEASEDESQAAVPDLLATVARLRGELRTAHEECATLKLRLREAEARAEAMEAANSCWRGSAEQARVSRVSFEDFDGKLRESLQTMGTSGGSGTTARTGAAAVKPTGRAEQDYAKSAFLGSCATNDPAFLGSCSRSDREQGQAHTETQLSQASFLRFSSGPPNDQAFLGSCSPKVLPSVPRTPVSVQ